MPRLHPSLIRNKAIGEGIDVPDPALLDLPERVVQFGTGTFLRAFVDYFIDKANRQGLFGGRIVMVGSTQSGRSALLNEQGGLFTLRIEGIEEGKAVEKYQIISSVSRALSAADEWSEVLVCARSPELSLVVSNTTEVEIQYNPDDRPGPAAPKSFPGKLTSFLFERARTFDYDREKGVTVLPCELIENNGAQLKAIVQKLSRDWGLGEAFDTWLDEAVFFCNTLVDRIAPGIPEPHLHQEIEKQLGYEDALLTSAEVYRLWAIEAPAEAKKSLDFTRADKGMVVSNDITPFRERKVCILNGAHSISVPLAFLDGEETVLDMMRRPDTRHFLERVVFDEIVPSLDVPQGKEFALDVIDRFDNPFLRHQLINITFQLTSKMRYRILPSLLRYVEKYKKVPKHIALGFAAYLLFMCVEEENGSFFGSIEGETYPVTDDQAAYFTALWVRHSDRSEASIATLVEEVCKHEPFWGMDLSSVEGFAKAGIQIFVFIDSFRSA